MITVNIAELKENYNKSLTPHNKLVKEKLREMSDGLRRGIMTNLGFPKPIIEAELEYLHEKQNEMTTQKLLNKYLVDNDIKVN